MDFSDIDEPRAIGPCNAEGDGGASKRPRSRLEALYNDRAAPIAAALRKMFGNGPPDPDDITQQAFENLMKRGSLSDVQNLNAFVWRTARNLFLEGKRQADIRSQYDFEVKNLYFAIQGDSLSPEGVISASVL